MPPVTRCGCGVQIACNSVQIVATSTPSWAVGRSPLTTTAGASMARASFPFEWSCVLVVGGGKRVTRTPHTRLPACRPFKYPGRTCS
jgi:hypothetical protein